jgi:hypothetical protein
MDVIGQKAAKCGHDSDPLEFSHFFSLSGQIAPSQ